MKVKQYQQLLREYGEALTRAAEVIPELVQDNGEAQTSKALESVIKRHYLPCTQTLKNFKKEKEKRKASQ